MATDLLMRYPTRFVAPPLRRITLYDRVPRDVPVSGVGRGLHVKIASTRREWEQAFELVADNYQARGYEPDQLADFRFTSHHALPDTVTFVAKDARQVVATFSLVPDNTLLGLPMEGIYGPEIRELRRAGRRLGEITNLACRDLGLREFLQVFVALIRLMMQHHLRHGGNSWVFTVNPRHRSYYCNVLGAMPLGSLRAYPAVRNAPAEALLLDPPLMRAKAPDMHQEIFGRRLPDEALIAPCIPAHLVHYFGAGSSQTSAAHVAEILQYVEESGSPRRW
jgi:hypothetical protein